MTPAELLAESLGDYLPRLFAALALLVVGFIVIGLLARALRRVLTSRDVDAVAERLGAHDVLGRARFERSLVRAIVLGVRLFLSLVVLFSAVAVLGPALLQDALGVALLFLPRLLLAIALLLVGAVLGPSPSARWSAGPSRWGCAGRSTRSARSPSWPSS